MPGDGIVSDPKVATDHAITIDAPPADVWPWLVQMGWGRAGWYTARWVDRVLFPANAPSADRIIPELQDVHVGTFIPDGPPHPIPLPFAMDDQPVVADLRGLGGIVPADFIMSRDMLRGVNMRAGPTSLEPVPER